MAKKGKKYEEQNPENVEKLVKKTIKLYRETSNAVGMKLTVNQFLTFAKKEGIVDIPFCGKDCNQGPQLQAHLILNLLQDWGADNNVQIPEIIISGKTVVFFTWKRLIKSVPNPVTKQVQKKGQKKG